ncbi:MAG: hypothetical protein Q4B57_01970 [Eubacteriales bacterium]|nr:hypothetical protein [Eubacteriales bacterium]
MKHRLTQNLGLKLISVLVACLIWLLVMDNNNPERTQPYRNIPITMINQDTITEANKTFTVVDGVNKANVYVTARRSVRDKLNPSSFNITANMEDYNEVTGAVPLTITCTDLTVAQENIRLVPSSLKINMEDKIEESFGIVVSAGGKAAKGYELGSTSILTGDTIRIAGPESLIHIIGKVTVPVDITGANASKIGQYAVRIEDKNGAVLTDVQMANLELKDTDGVVLQKGMVQVSTQIWRMVEVPLNVRLRGEPARGYRVTDISLTPKSVNLAASSSALENLENELVLNDTISIQGVSESQEYTLDLNDTLAEYDNVRLEADTSSTVTVSVTVQEVGSRTYDIPISDITMQNVPRDKKLIFSPTDKISVTVHSATEDLDEISASDIQAVLDLAECVSNGSYTLPVEITLPEHYEQTGTTTIVVNVEDVEIEEEAEALTEE